MEYYDPAEDTHLLLDALNEDAERIRSIEPLFCVEIGCGSGVVIVELAKIAPGAVRFATDINPAALAATQRLAADSGVPVELVRTDLVAALETRLRGRVDVLVFNPPYVPTESSEVGTPDISAAWAGGFDGREVIDRLLPRLPALLADRALFYMVALQENRPKEIAETMRRMGFDSKVVLRRRAGGESLYVVRYSRTGAGGG
eukprot:tig00000640_g2762.t1